MIIKFNDDYYVLACNLFPIRYVYYELAKSYPGIEEDVKRRCRLDLSLTTRTDEG